MYAGWGEGWWWLCYERGAVRVYREVGRRGGCACLSIRKRRRAGGLGGGRVCLCRYADVCIYR